MPLSWSQVQITLKDLFDMDFACYAELRWHNDEDESEASGARAVGRFRRHSSHRQPR